MCSHGGGKEKEDKVSHPPHMMFGAPPYVKSYMCKEYMPVHWRWGSDLIEHRIS